jgi:hypothetical protein
MATNNYFSGYWLSRYDYPSSSRGRRFVGEHLVKAFQRGNKLVFESVNESKKNKSYLVARLVIDNIENVATGSWQESTDKNGHYKGAVYHGSVQLDISDDKELLRGKWLGFGKDREINSGEWEFKHLGKSLPEEGKQPDGKKGNRAQSRKS